jgi:hypothetical protein
MNPETIPLLVLIFVAFIAAVIGFGVIIAKILLYRAMISDHIRDMGEYRRGV